MVYQPQTLGYSQFEQMPRHTRGLLSIFQSSSSKWTPPAIPRAEVIPVCIAQHYRTLSEVLSQALRCQRFKSPFRVLSQPHLQICVYHAARLSMMSNHVSALPSTLYCRLLLCPFVSEFSYWILSLYFSLTVQVTSVCGWLRLAVFACVNGFCCEHTDKRQILKSSFC
ncbi:uncharacterized protein LY89DRAFT_159618 [Mollisia scopiformis]|uniref:Uncharacterized protein n=1 Tax=Mollisia scopiformis TaxID=149040 RepID=A0A194X018_MOLSC|nr:uncharacterized protein LY89DRAFT_159618 [Mollisia scopiformis]KUJ13535.1 hypothetical protein LY89DRAFT_159618 [Mollisia scopiformis]